MSKLLRIPSRKASTDGFSASSPNTTNSPSPTSPDTSNSHSISPTTSPSETRPRSSPSPSRNSKFHSLASKMLKTVKSQFKTADSPYAVQFPPRRASDASTKSVSSTPAPIDPAFLNQLSYSVGVAEEKNGRCRASMEDVHTIVYNFMDKMDAGYFAIFDGHAGRQSARWCGHHLHEYLAREITHLESLQPGGNVPLAFDRSFRKADDALRDKCGKSGTTVAAAVLRWETVAGGAPRRMLYAANVGDARVVLCRSGVALRLTYDHKGSDDKEAARVSGLGGIMVANRVNGVLAVTRALGDAYLKKLVTGRPYTTSTSLGTEDEFMIIACDGLWDVCTDQQAVNLIRHEKDADAAAKMLVAYALKRFSTDNLTCMVVRFDKEMEKMKEEEMREKEEKEEAERGEKEGQEGEKEEEKEKKEAGETEEGGELSQGVADVAEKGNSEDTSASAEGEASAKMAQEEPTSALSTETPSIEPPQTDTVDLTENSPPENGKE